MSYPCSAKIRAFSKFIKSILLIGEDISISVLSQIELFNLSPSFVYISYS